MRNQLSCEGCCQWVGGGVIVDDCYKKGLSWLWTQCSAVLYISSATAPEYDNSVETGYTEPQLPVLSLFAVCQALSAEYTPGCLLTQRSAIHSHNAVSVWLQSKSMRACLVGDNSLCICLCIIVVLRRHWLHEAGVWCLTRPGAGRFCAAVMQRSLPNLCLLFTQMWAGGVICNMTEIYFVWWGDSMIPCLLKTNSSIVRQLFPEQTDLCTISHAQFNLWE